MKLQIKSRYDSSVILYEGEAESTRALLKMVISDKADLSGAYLSGKNLSDTNLTGICLPDADLSYVNLFNANLTEALLSGVYFYGADLSYVNFSYANLSHAEFSGSNLTDARLSGANLANADLPYAPKIDNLDSKILEAIKSGGTLNMNEWHTCKTAHCRAGWAIHIAGEEGKALEEQHGTAIAGTLIYQVSTGRVPDFYASDEDALSDIKKCAASATSKAIGKKKNKR